MISNLNNGMMTKIWGPAGWLFLHCVTYGYPLNPENNDIQNGIPVGKTRQNYKDFFLRIGDVLPCKYCRDSYKKFIITDPITPNLNNRNLLTKWLWRIHNRVNEKLGDHYCDAEPSHRRQRRQVRGLRCLLPLHRRRDTVPPSSAQ